MLVDVTTVVQGYKGKSRVLADTVEGKAEIYPDLLTEVTNLVEFPTAVLGKFEPEFFARLPSEVIATVMIKHQRYFPCQR